eukprot:1107658-Prymnesium_polylepis.1
MSECSAVEAHCALLRGGSSPRPSVVPCSGTGGHMWSDRARGHVVTWSRGGHVAMWPRGRVVTWWRGHVVHGRGSHGRGHGHGHGHGSHGHGAHASLEQKGHMGSDGPVACACGPAAVQRGARCGPAAVQRGARCGPAA